MKNLFNCKILADVKEKLDALENSFVDLECVSYKAEKPEEIDFTGLYSNKKYFIKKSYTFLPL